MRGTVRWFSPHKGFGFIYCDELRADIFCHASGLVANADGIKSVRPEDEVEFDAVKEARGLRAKNVKVIKGEGNENAETK